MVGNDKVYDVAIIGAGPSGLFSAFEAGMLNMSAVVIDRLDKVGGQCSMLYPDKMIYDIPAIPKITAKQFISSLEEQLKTFEPELLLATKVLDIQKSSDEERIFHLSCEKEGVKSSITAKSVIIATGGGIFTPKKLPIEGLERFEEKSVHYSVEDINFYNGKEVLIAGGGDSAVDWAVSLAGVAKKVYVVHRRRKFRAMPSSVDKMFALEEEGKIEMVIPYQVKDIKGDDESGMVSSVLLESIDDERPSRILNVDACLFCFGLVTSSVSDWGAKHDGKGIEVNSINMCSSVDGIFAVGDASTYPGKLKLILCGFAEAARACHSAYEFANPDKALHFEYSTTKMAGKV